MRVVRHREGGGLGAPLPFLAAVAAEPASFWLRTDVFSSAKPSGSGDRFIDPWWAEEFATANPMLGGATRLVLQDVPANGTARIGWVLGEIARRREAAERGAPTASAGGDAILSGADVGDFAATVTAWVELEKAREADESRRQRAAYAKAASYLVGDKAGAAWADYVVSSLDKVGAFLVGEGNSHPEGTRAAYRSAAEAIAYIASTIGVWPPFNLFSVTAYGNAWEDSQLARDIVGDIRDRWMRTTAAEREPVRAAWLATLANSTDERVRDALLYAPWNAQGLADDTMVYLAALGPALATGNDPRELAITLWDRSAGLADPLVTDSAEHQYDGSPQSNAAERLWIVLCRDAWEWAKVPLRFSVSRAISLRAGSDEEPLPLLDRGMAKAKDSQQEAPAPLSTGEKVAIGVGVVAAASTVAIVAVPVLRHAVGDFFSGLFRGRRGRRRR